MTTSSGGTAARNLSRMSRCALLIAALLIIPLSSSKVLSQTSPSSPDSGQLGAARSAIVRVIPGDSTKLPGTGFIVKIDQRAAYILTASHVVEGGTAPKVEFFTQRDKLVSAQIAEGAEWGDAKGLALLIVPVPLPEGLTELRIDTNTRLDGGEPITVIGHPASGSSWAVSRGDINSRQGRVLYFSAPIDKGNSGGPLLLGGTVVGIVTNKGSTFGEAVEALTIFAFLGGNDIYRAPSSSTSRATPPPSVAPAAAALPPPTTTTISAVQAGQVFKDCADCPEMVVVPAGSFLMGSPESEQGRSKDEGPQHKVSIPRPLAIGRAEVTRAQFARFVADTGHKTEGGCYAWDAKAFSSRADASWSNPGFAQSDDHPVVCVNWNDAKAYAQWLAKKTGKNYRLLSEAEWEYAARAGQTTARYWGETFDPEGCKYANIHDATAMKEAGWTSDARCDDKQAYTAPVRSYAANKFGLYDMIGNAWEWTEDCWNDSYSSAPENSDAWSKGECGRRVLRGGSWDGGPDNARSADRVRGGAGSRVVLIGFRLARTD
jgi:formylglycine-generating enzyme required for sulfatase activity